MSKETRYVVMESNYDNPNSDAYPIHLIDLVDRVIVSALPRKYKNEADRECSELNAAEENRWTVAVGYPLDKPSLFRQGGRTITMREVLDCLNRKELVCEPDN